MKNARMQRAAAALMMAAVLMISVGSAEAKKASRETPAAVVSTESRGGVLQPATRYPEDRGIGGQLSIERDNLWKVLGHLYWN